MRLPYTKLAPEAYARLSALGHYLSTETTLEPVLLELIFLRASTLNGCNFCVGLHTAALKKHNEPDTRIDAIKAMDSIADWQASDAFTPREQAALAWTDVLTNLQATHASDADFAAISEHFHDKNLVDLTFAIAEINAWNRLGVAFGAEWKPRPAAPVPETNA
ncbi:alkylhydroperoxidase AhpD family core domain-containing protein [Bryocella elongata]|uniref:Alkylhydroperoxidase AhpD family core domain-containing protein n=1 Tax=Bryocella elongata TaxID=863522 RepID=A0A1H5SLN2_9BACT|nr:carboxymuconolactone decarboxylase family protein [Bryocella elongata]SEF51509.1 alkylhydroperoxidase AhpD family core domain-containing protein [Bryocella elongata]